VAHITMSTAPDARTMLPNVRNRIGRVWGTIARTMMAKMMTRVTIGLRTKMPKRFADDRPESNRSQQTGRAAEYSMRILGGSSRAGFGDGANLRRFSAAFRATRRSGSLNQLSAAMLAVSKSGYPNNRTNRPSDHVSWEFLFDCHGKYP